MSCPSVASRPGGKAEPAADFYVAVDGRDHWSGTLPEPNGEGTDGPFATLARARDAVRELVRQGNARDLRVYLRGGVYYLPQGIAFGPEDAGTADCRVTYAAAPGEAPTLVGGVRVVGWRRLGPSPPEVLTGRLTPELRERIRRGSIFVADIPEGIEPTQLFEDDGGTRRMEFAREPDEGYFQVERAVPGKPTTAFVYRAEDLSPGHWDWAGGRVFLWPTHDWFSVEKPIAGIDPRERIIRLEGRGGRNIRAGNRYFVRNVLALLDRPGECVVRLDEGKLYAWPRQAGWEKKGLIASTAASVITVRGEPDRPVRNLHFEGLDIGIANGDVVSISGAEGCSLRFCKVENGRERGVLVHGHAQRITVYGCLIREHGLHGVELQGLRPGKPDVNHHHLVENNHIHHCGRLVGHGYGVRISQSGHNRITHNHIHHMPRYATTIKGIRYQVLKTRVEGVTFENRHDFLHSRHNLLAYNHIHHVNLDSQDTGAMESWGPGRDNVYDHNLIHHCGNDRFDLQSGLYLDDATDYFTVTNNVIYAITGTRNNQPIYAKGIGNRIHNNILVVGPTNDTAIRSFTMAGERCDHHVTTRNIIVFEGRGLRKKGRFGGGVGNIHPKGTTLRWRVTVPATGRYRVWLRYAAHNKPYGTDDMGGRTTLRAGDGEPVPLLHLPDTGGWGTQKWSPKPCATLRLEEGSHTLTWTNVRGGGLNWDAFALCTDPDWRPQGVHLDPPAPGHHLVVVQAETHEQPGDLRTVYHFQNWSADRVAEADHNLFWKPGGPILVRKGAETLSLDPWRELEGHDFDAHSRVADPRFADLAGRDFRLPAASPARELGFQPIDTSRIGLKADFPARFEREVSR
ncbi:MAG: right-handed parallel beta-helix repeat-containing protein [Candidatus Brocadiia bacterium]